MVSAAAMTGGCMRRGAISGGPAWHRNWRADTIITTAPLPAHGPAWNAAIFAGIAPLSSVRSAGDRGRFGRTGLFGTVQLYHAPAETVRIPLCPRAPAARHAPAPPVRTAPAQGPSARASGRNSANFSKAAPDRSRNAGYGPKDRAHKTHGGIPSGATAPDRHRRAGKFPVTPGPRHDPPRVPPDRGIALPFHAADPRGSIAVDSHPMVDLGRQPEYAAAQSVGEPRFPTPFTLRGLAR